jgi:hypothetical protein
MNSLFSIIFSFIYLSFFIRKNPKVKEVQFLWLFIIDGDSFTMILGCFKEKDEII